MPWLEDPPLSLVLRRTENNGEPVNDRRLRSRIQAGELVRIGPGSYADAKQWRELSPMARHAQIVWEAAARLREGQVFSHFAAAALHGIDTLGRWPSTIDVSVALASGGRSTGFVRRHGRDLATVEPMPWGRHFVTTPLQTTVDLIRALPFLQGVVVADRALWVRRPGGPLVRREDLAESAARVVGRGSARAGRAAAFATHQADSVRESQSRVIISVLGFPEPELQAGFVLSDGRDAYADFFWPEYRHIGEFDGVDKYHDTAMLKGRDPADILLAEKDREDDLRRQVRAFSRWRTPQLESPRRLYDILTAAGLPSSRGRPGR